MPRSALLRMNAVNTVVSLRELLRAHVYIGPEVGGNGNAGFEQDFFHSLRRDGSHKRFHIGNIRTGKC